jgi:multidrug resistance efflux pump
MRAGQEATISIDTYPGRVFKAHVTSMSPGAGSAGDHLQHSLRLADVP